MDSIPLNAPDTLDRAAMPTATTGLSEQQLARRLRGVYATRRRLAREYTPARFAGEPLLFCTRPHATQSWLPYVDGEIHRHPVGCEPVDMLRPAGLAQIGPLLASALEHLIPKP